LSSEEKQAQHDARMPFVQPRGQLATVLNLSTVTFLVMLGLSMVAPILPGYAADFGVSYALVGFVISSFAIARMLLDMPAGFLSRRYNKKIIMISGLMLIVVSSIMAGSAPNYVALVIARMIEGAGSALHVTTATVFLAQIAGTEKRGQLMSVYSGTLLLGSVFGPTFGGFIAAVYDIHAPFYAYAIVAGLGVVPTLALPNLASSENVASLKRRLSRIHDVWVVLSHPSFLLGTMATFTLFFIRTGVKNTLVPLYAQNNLGLDSTAIGLILTFAGLATAVTMVPVGSLSDRIGRRNPIMLCLLLSAVATLFIPLSVNMVQLSICVVAYGAAVGLSGPIAAYVTDVSPEDKLEVSMGLFRTISDVGFFAGPLLLGYLSDISATPPPGDGSMPAQIGMLPFLVASVILIVAGLVFAKADDPARTRSKQHPVI